MTTQSGDMGDGRLSDPQAPNPVSSTERRVRRPHARPGRLTLHFITVLLGASGVAFAIGGARAGLSMALGVGLAGANLLLMQKITSRMLGGSLWVMALPFKLVALVGVAYALVSLGVAQPVPLAIGFALLPLTGVFLPRPTSVAGARPAP